jgi:sugar lactone lactonase YvrE
VTATRATASIVADGLAFPECPRWHDGRYWLADMHVAQVLSYSPDDWAAPRVELVLDRSGGDARTAGIGFLPDGRLLAVSSLDSTVRRRERSGDVVVHADLRDVTRGWCNDMVVDAAGRAYVGSYGANYQAGESHSDVCLALVEPDGTTRAVGDPLAFPNGAVLTPDGRTLIVGESLAETMTAFTVNDDGSLSDRRAWAELPDTVRPDGACLDADGAIWVSSFATGEVLRVHEGGDVSAVVTVPDRVPFACALGGDDRRTLLVCAANTWRAEETVPKRDGVVAVCVVDVPGAGWP